MKTIEEYGNYSINQYNEDLITIDYSNENIGMTIQTFNNVNKAKEAFNNIILKGDQSK